MSSPKTWTNKWTSQLYTSQAEAQLSGKLHCFPSMVIPQP